MNNALEKGAHIPFDCKEITKRIKETTVLIKAFKLVAKYPDKGHFSILPSFIWVVLIVARLLVPLGRA